MARGRPRRRSRLRTGRSRPNATRTGGRPLLVTSLGGSRMGTLTAVHAHRPADTLVLPSRQSVLSGVREAAARTLHAAENPGADRPEAAELKEGGYRDRVRFTPEPVDGSDTEAVTGVARRWIAEQRSGGAAAPVVVDITTGTKAMSLGLALARAGRAPASPTSSGAGAPWSA
ncbi:hypothetical protein HFP72_07000 [Nocardiopsis sp. ARC36]